MLSIYHEHRAVFKWLSKVITWLLSDWLKRVAPVFQPMRSKTITNRMIFPALRPSYRWLLGIDWFIALFPPVLIAQSNCFGFGFSTVIWKPLFFYAYATFSALFRLRKPKGYITLPMNDCKIGPIFFLSSHSPQAMIVNKGYSLQSSAIFRVTLVVSSKNTRIRHSVQEKSNLFLFVFVSRVNETMRWRHKVNWTHCRA